MKVYELLDKPEKWTKGENARDAEGNKVRPDNPTAVCWCLEGAIRYCYGESWRTSYYKAEDAVQDMSGGYLNAFEWNDAPRRTYKQVIALCKKLDI